MILLTSDEPWGDIWHTQLHYAYQLSKRTRVLFLGPPAPWHWKNLFHLRLNITRPLPGLEVITYHNALPASLGKLALGVNDRINERLIRKKYPEFGRQAHPLVWHFDPYRSHLIFRKLKSVKHLFHVIDPIAGFNLDAEMASRADLVVVTSPKFVTHYLQLNRNVLQVGQGADLDFFSRKVAPQEVQQLVSNDSILLLGTFSDEIGYDFLINVAQRYPGKLVLIGPDKTSAGPAREKFHKLCALEGVHWLGAMPPERFYPHLLACRVGIIAYTYENYERNNLRSPLKVISYLASGKCIVSNIDCEIPALSDKAIYLVHDDQGFFEKLDRAFSGQLQFDRSAVEAYLDGISYDRLLGAIYNALGVPLPNKK